MRRMTPLRLAPFAAFAAFLAAQGTPPPAPATAPAAAITVATHYFYWYHWPSEHFNEPGAPGPEGHCHHLEHPETVSYRNTAWHAANFRAMGEAGIDAALPVYWGAPGAYERPNVAFSRLGLPPMVQALDDLAAAHTKAPKLGLFYDTSTLANDVRGATPAGGRADLTTPAGQDLFCTTITDYFAAIPPRHWARHRGRALVVLYVSAFAQAWDEHLGDRLRERFAARFPGEAVCLVADASWGRIGQDLTTSWGAALWGPKTFPGVAQIGPGYDDRAVPGRRTPVREREDGAFYRSGWRQVLAQQPELVLLETWNELHEGTELCPTRELGRLYLDLTRDGIASLHRGDAPGPAIALRFPEPRVQPDLSWGAEAKGRAEVSADFARGERIGLREVAVEDGPCRVVDGALRAGAGKPGLGSYLYFQVSDHLLFDGDADCVVDFELAAPARLDLEFDSRDTKATLQGAYTRAQPAPAAPGHVAFALPHARFANRQNGGADLRLVLVDHAASVRRIVLRRS